MKTYKKTITKELPCLVIRHDQDAESPRAWDGSIGYFLTQEDKYNSPDGTEHPLYRIMIETVEDAISTDDHMQRIKAQATSEDIHIAYIYPVNRYEHGNIIYRRGTAKGFDYSNCGFFIVTKEKLKETGMKNAKTNIERSIDQELKTYTNWANGEVYGFTLHDEDGNEIDSYWGFFDIEDIREYLPEEYKDEELEQYFAN